MAWPLPSYVFSALSASLMDIFNVWLFYIAIFPSSIYIIRQLLAYVIYAVGSILFLRNNNFIIIYVYSDDFWKRISI